MLLRGPIKLRRLIRRSGPRPDTVARSEAPLVRPCYWAVAVTPVGGWIVDPLLLP